MRNGYCSRLSGVIWLHVIADALRAAAYLMIPMALIQLIRCCRDLEFPWILIPFSISILACGATHILNIVTLWYPVYRYGGIVKAVTAISSVLTSAALFRLLPVAVSLPSPAHLRCEMQDRLIAENSHRQLSETLAQRVDERTHDLTLSNPLRTQHPRVTIDFAIS